MYRLPINSSRDLTFVYENCFLLPVCHIMNESHARGRIIELNVLEFVSHSSSHTVSNLRYV